jgi:exodeoxyribonuclease-3
MKLATFNVNGVNGRLPVLLRWLEQAAPDIVCLQELKAPQDKFPEGPLRETLKRAMYGRAGVDLLRARMLPLQG